MLQTVNRILSIILYRFICISKARRRRSLTINSSLTRKWSFYNIELNNNNWVIWKNVLTCVSWLLLTTSPSTFCYQINTSSFVILTTIKPFVGFNFLFTCRTLKRQLNLLGCMLKKNLRCPTLPYYARKTYQKILFTISEFWCFSIKFASIKKCFHDIWTTARMLIIVFLFVCLPVF